ncbi:restriction endonuclease subunit S [Deinococcus arboris]|uniref:restriction endonuclease subunit S n=1 Tax=Deinococcus arboris TaxID=2682977 RepID=UPI0018DBCB53
MLKTTAITWTGWNQYANKILPAWFPVNQDLQVRTGDILITKAGPRERTGVIAYANDVSVNIVPSGKMLCLRINPAKAEARYVYRAMALPEARQYLNDRTTGMAESQVNFANEVVLDLPLELPPLPEQRRIADILDTLDRTIEGTQRIIVKLQAARQGLLHDLLTRGVDERGHLRDPEKTPELFKDTVLGRVPRDWEVVRVADVLAQPPRNGYSPSEVPSYNGTLMLGLGCLTPHGFSPRQLKNAPEQDSRLSAYFLQDGDLLLSRANTRQLVAAVGIYRDVGVPCIYPDLMMRLVPLSIVSAQFLELLLRLPKVRRQMIANAQGTSESMVKISSAIVREVRVPLPSRAEQMSIESVLGANDDKLRVEQAQLAKLLTLKRGLMEDLLTGRKRVSVGESEPAKQAETEPLANISFESPRTPAFDPVVNFRASAGVDPAAQTDWVAQAREIAARQQVAAYSREALDRAVADLAELSRTLDGILQVPDVLKAAGVRFVLLKHPKGSKTSGAAFWLDAGAKSPTQPVVALSMRYPHIDVFWFNLFHELGHIWHNHAAVMGEELVTYSDPAPAEQEAHAYAREALIPDAIWQPYLHTGNHTMRGILAFARTVGRHHATVAGRLGNDLKDFPRFNSRDHRPTVPTDLFDRLLLRLGGSL